jgi:putative salt-induced outer membrane protein YdiY
MMGRIYIFGAWAFFGAIISFAETTITPDRVEVKGGAVLIGQVESVRDGVLQMQTSYAGLLAVDITEVQSVVLGTQRNLDLPTGIAVSTSESSAPATPQVKPVVAKQERPRSDFMRGWSVDAGVDLNGNSGNSERFDLRLTFEAELERELDRLNLYGHYAYGTNQGVPSANETVGGFRYTNYVFDEVGLFMREEVEQDEFEGIRFRSTSAAGLIFEFQNDKRLRLEARTGLSYRYEDYIDDGTGDFPGMDIGMDINWRFVEWARFKGTYSFLPSIRDFEDYIFEQDSGINLPLDESEFWKLRLGISNQFNSQPDTGREKLDTRYYARLIASWY